jgi:hypothetical protein
VVWCYFPYDEALNEPADDEHPCLVLETMLDDLDRPFVRLISGTSNPGRTGPQYFRVPELDGRSCGLSKTTMFNLRKVGRRIPWAEEYFRRPEGRHLPPSMVTEFQTHAAYYQHQTGWNPFEA